MHSSLVRRVRCLLLSMLPWPLLAPATTAQARDREDPLALVRAGHRSAVESIRTLYCSVVYEFDPPDPAKRGTSEFWRSGGVSRFRERLSGACVDFLAKDSILTWVTTSVKDPMNPELSSAVRDKGNQVALLKTASWFLQRGYVTDDQIPDPPGRGGAGRRLAGVAGAVAPQQPQEVHPGPALRPAGLKAVLHARLPRPGHLGRRVGRAAPSPGPAARPALLDARLRRAPPFKKKRGPGPPLPGHARLGPRAWAVSRAQRPGGQKTAPGWRAGTCRATTASAAGAGSGASPRSRRSSTCGTHLCLAAAVERGPKPDAPAFHRLAAQAHRRKAVPGPARRRRLRRRGPPPLPARPLGRPGHHPAAARPPGRGAAGRPGPPLLGRALAARQAPLPPALAGREPLQPAQAIARPGPALRSRAGAGPRDLPAAPRPQPHDPLMGPLDFSTKHYRYGLQQPPRNPCSHRVSKG